MAKKRATKTKNGGTSALVPIGSGSLPDYGGRQSVYLSQQRISTPLTAGMPRIRAGQGFFLLPGSSAGVATFDAIVLCALRANRWREAKYDPKKPGPPDCVAIARLGQHENAMAPNPAWPKVQAESCLVCQHNTRGGRKDCRNGIDLALVSAQGEGEIDWAKTALVSHTISSTGIPPWGKTVAYLSEKKLPEIFALVLRFRSIPEETWYVTVTEPVAYVPPHIVDALAKRVPEAEQALLANAEPFVATVAGEPDTSAKPPVRRSKTPAKHVGRSTRTL